MDGKAREVGPESRPHVLAKLDRRTREFRLLQKVRDDLTGHLGGRPSATQAALIERVAWLSLRVALFDEQIAAGTISEHASRTYLAWSNTLSRTLRTLGLESRAAEPPSLAELLSSDGEHADEASA